MGSTAVVCYPPETVTTPIRACIPAWKRSTVTAWTRIVMEAMGLVSRGEYGDTWINASFSAPGVRGLQEFLEVGAEHMYVGHSSSGFWRMNLDTESWESLASPPGSLANWGSAALANDGGVWQIRSSQAYRYDIPPTRGARRTASGPLVTSRA